MLSFIGLLLWYNSCPRQAMFPCTDSLVRYRVLVQFRSKVAVFVPRDQIDPMRSETFRRDPDTILMVVDEPEGVGASDTSPRSLPGDLPREDQVKLSLYPTST